MQRLLAHKISPRIKAQNGKKMQRASRKVTYKHHYIAEMLGHLSERAPSACRVAKEETEAANKHPTTNHTKHKHPPHQTTRPPCNRPPHQREGGGSKSGPKGQCITVATKSRSECKRTPKRRQKTSGPKSRTATNRPNTNPTQQTRTTPKHPTPRATGFPACFVEGCAPVGPLFGHMSKRAPSACRVAKEETETAKRPPHNTPHQTQTPAAPNHQATLQPPPS
jgi:hypothetical protein